MAHAATQTVKPPPAPSWEQKLGSVGWLIFALGLIGFGVENIGCARTTLYLQAQPPRWPVIPVLPWLAAVPVLGWVVGAILAVCGIALLLQKATQWAALTAGILLLVTAVAFDLPRFVPHAASMGLRTLLFEPLAIAALALLLSGVRRIEGAASVVLAVSLLVFGAGHLISVASHGLNRAIFASVMPPWLPWPVFWIGFFGVAFLAAAISLGAGVQMRWGALGLGAMFGLWVVTLNIPRLAGWYPAPGASLPDELSSLLIDVVLCGGVWALLGTRRLQR